ncbi:hypothetical protein RhiirA5_431934 [Rhizophagus irregularis]|uniref:Protein kinase domain-containing protein n=1 Tax=Rhizophagus irregularis TaxID=588596 RepID=A0A2I1EY24_9GLOM|nr:hypothetical protein RhiirA5_431934 [Rhizophagus irregularis]PKC66506.1 hypothetical protein RhiirA1_459662 [Rhizophagus irregularis]PKY27032.1 hypothetical protein RhiirB3_442588 [Rhizophagus irregularis]
MEKCTRSDLISSLTDKVNQRDAGRITRDLLNALKHLHHYGIIHRDIKLPNILVTANDEIKLGITSSLTPTSTAMAHIWHQMFLLGLDQPYDTTNYAKVDFLEKCFIKNLKNKWSAEKLLEYPFITKLI